MDGRSIKPTEIELTAGQGQPPCPRVWLSMSKVKITRSIFWAGYAGCRTALGPRLLRACLCPPRFWILLVCLSLFASACATPVGVRRVDPRVVHRELTSDVLTTGKPSGPTQIILNKYDLFERYEDDPEEALAELQETVVTGNGGADEVFALAELSFLHAEKTGQRPYHLAASIYAYAFLFPDDPETAPSPYDPRLRLACDLYNRGITSGFKSADGSYVELRSGTFELPFGTMEVEFDPASLFWYGRRLVNFEPVSELEVRGLRNRYRQSGIGAPLAASTILPDPDQERESLIGPKAKVPVTAILRMDGARKQLVERRIHATLELYATDRENQVAIGGQNIPLEAETSATFASRLADSGVWEMETKGFLGQHVRGILLKFHRTSQLVALRPYKPGRIPVVFVHGTASSPGRWANMTNDLWNDPVLRERFAFWYFFYDTGNPIVYSAALLRDSLQETVERLDPQHSDPALQRMVVIGHSQGGLLAKMTAIDSGNLFWANVSRKPFEELKLREETRELLRRALFVKPLPFVKRVIYVATPHRGSFLAGWRIVTRLTHWFVKLPGNVLGMAGDVLKGEQDAQVTAALKKIPTSVENMNPNHPFIKTLGSIPTVPGVATHSIIAVKGKGPAEKGNDGVVKYESAHLEGVESELVVRSGHSCQDNPHVIEEVRRILLLIGEGER